MRATLAEASVESGAGDAPWTWARKGAVGIVSIIMLLDGLGSLLLGFVVPPLIAVWHPARAPSFSPRSGQHLRNDHRPFVGDAAHRGM